MIDDIAIQLLKLFVPWSNQSQFDKDSQQYQHEGYYSYSQYCSHYRYSYQRSIRWATGSIILLAWSGGAFIDIHRAVVTGETVVTNTRVRVEIIHANAERTRRRNAFGKLGSASRACVALFTRTSERVNRLRALTMYTRVRAALVDVYWAITASEASIAFTRKRQNMINTSAVDTGIWGAFVDVLITISTIKTPITQTSIEVQVINAVAVNARIRTALINFWKSTKWLPVKKTTVAYPPVSHAVESITTTKYITTHSLTQGSDKPLNLLLHVDFTK